MKLPGWTGTVLHTLAGAAIAGFGLFVGLPDWVMVPVVAAGGWLREVLQHDLKLTAHQWLEAAGWLLGALGAAIVWWCLT